MSGFSIFGSADLIFKAEACYSSASKEGASFGSIKKKLSLAIPMISPLLKGAPCSPHRTSLLPTLTGYFLERHLTSHRMSSKFQMIKQCCLDTFLRWPRSRSTCQTALIDIFLDMYEVGDLPIMHESD